MPCPYRGRWRGRPYPDGGKQKGFTGEGRLVQCAGVELVSMKR